VVICAFQVRTKKVHPVLADGPHRFCRDGSKQYDWLSEVYLFVFIIIIIIIVVVVINHVVNKDSHSRLLCLV